MLQGRNSTYYLNADIETRKKIIDRLKRFAIKTQSRKFMHRISDLRREEQNAIFN